MRCSNVSVPTGSGRYSYSWWIAVILGFKSGGCGTIIDYDGSSSDVQLYPKERLGIGPQQDSPDRYSYGGTNSHKSCVDQEDRWVIKFRLGLNLYLIKM